MTSGEAGDPQEMRNSRDQVIHRAALGTQQFINPKSISPDDDMVMLSGIGKTIRWLGVLVSVLVMLLGVGLIIDGVYGFGNSRAQDLFGLATNPLIGLMVGILATALLQSSTATTAITVTAVGLGVISVPVAIPVIMGANIGTTVTVFIISYSYIGHREEFRRAFASAAVHGFFNLLMVLLLVPIEFIFAPLRRVSGAMASSVFGDVLGPSDTGTFITAIFQPAVDFIGNRGLLGEIFIPTVAAVMTILLGTALIVIGVRAISVQLRTLMAAATHTLLERSSGTSDALGLLTGTVGTMTLQASSVTVSSLLPFSAAGSLKLREVLAITLGANVGTTLSSLLVALALPGSLGSFALQAAIVHLLFNVLGALLVLLLPPLRKLILFLATRLADFAVRSYTLSFVLLMGYFFLLPAAVIGVYSLLN
ncbi:Na+/Pi-cotransporter [Corynebacterium occultum]|uniref:Na+/Pi-cotransporter n=2 Tax=Corynebacterium occultum TaxID=2675219 RepID=A0A6B8WEF3_9CORY|nr:Na+/Pi-cotransporter [Corynebacterium occultum]